MALATAALTKFGILDKLARADRTGHFEVQRYAPVTWDSLAVLAYSGTECGSCVDNFEAGETATHLF